MAEEQYLDQTSKSVPPQYLADLYAGAGAGVPGMIPLLNQDIYNKFATMGVPGMNPYTYQGMRVAPFSQMQQQGFNKIGQGVGSYQPYFNAAGQGLTRGADTATQGFNQMGDLYGKGIGATESSVGQGMNLLGQSTGMYGKSAGILGNVPGMSSNLYSQSLQGYNPNSVGNYMNPYTENVVDKTLGRMRQGIDRQRTASRDSAVGAGAFGGSRGRLTEENIERAGQTAMGDTAAGLYGQNYAQAQQAAMGESALQRQLQQSAGSNLANIYGGVAGGLQNVAGGLGNVAGGVGSLGSQLANVYGGYGTNLGKAGLGLGQFMGNTGMNMANLGGMQYGLQGQDINRLMQGGGMQQGMQQRIADTDYGNFVGQYNLPSQILGQGIGMTSPVLGALGGTSNTNRYATGTGSDSLMDNLATALSAYGAYKQWGK